jgi:hypothetical protein
MKVEYSKGIGELIQLHRRTSFEASGRKMDEFVMQCYYAFIRVVSA